MVRWEHCSNSSFSKLILGLLLLFGGALATKWFRDHFFIKSSLPELGFDLSHKFLGDHFNLAENLGKLFYHNLFSRYILITFFFIGIAVFFAANMAKITETVFKALLVFISLCLAILMLGQINETRVYIVLFPFLIFFYREFTKTDIKSA
jgi:hypothetical protein